MRRAKLFCGGLAINLGLVTVLPSTFAGCGGRDVTAIQHTVFIVKENHTFDNYFGTFAGADGSTSGATSDGHILPLNPMPDAYQANDLCNSWDCAIEAIDGGKMASSTSSAAATWTPTCTRANKTFPTTGRMHIGLHWPINISHRSMGPASPTIYFRLQLNRMESSLTRKTRVQAWLVMELLREPSPRSTPAVK